MADLNLHEIHDYLIELAQKAGDMITSAHPTVDATDSKKNSADLVTETDTAVENLISTSLSAKYPKISFMGEETYKPGDRLSSSPTFVVDPIDGTNNFVHSYPYVSISLGLTIDREPVLGVVYNPFTQTLYSAIKGSGAFMNRSTRLPLRSAVPPLGRVSNALVCSEWGSARAGNDFAVRCATYAALMREQEHADGPGGMAHGMRMFGSAALNLCGVASGALDCYWEAGIWAWDVCAGWAILTEAGGLMVDANPGNWKPEVDDRRVLAVRKGEGQKEFVEEFWGLVQGRLEVGPE
ncbi:hypothetical protein BDY21DRAFT_320351 [Lineolata rhizophorae]|uniref:Inositol-1-monophosphatase n=1 Tax=Lineolata rhizophorae TaxID=578093 RepID=A0A6A6P2B6_9PEZI|nr:hypothetical protein BDY21DRAFT_320351 [Lineolata rhizophorae]